ATKRRRLSRDPPPKLLQEPAVRATECRQHFAAIETTARRGATTPAGARLARDRRKAASASEIGRPRDAAAEEKRRMNPPRGAALCRALFDRARHSVVLQAEAAECGLACL